MCGLKIKMLVKEEMALYIPGQMVYNRYDVRTMLFIYMAAFGKRGEAIARRSHNN